MDKIGSGKLDIFWWRVRTYYRAALPCVFLVLVGVQAAAAWWYCGFKVWVQATYTHAGP
jgi:hypothetical protein